MHNITSLSGLLTLFRSEDIAHVLRALGGPISGIKSERIHNLLALITDYEKNKGANGSEILQVFRLGGLERVCTSLGLPTGDKSAMADTLYCSIDSDTSSQTQENAVESLINKPTTNFSSQPEKNTWNPHIQAQPEKPLRAKIRGMMPVILVPAGIVAFLALVATWNTIFQEINVLHSPWFFTPAFGAAFLLFFFAQQDSSYKLGSLGAILFLVGCTSLLASGGPTLYPEWYDGCKPGGNC